jgi:ABC-2 type transport system permease protein
VKKYLTIAKAEWLDAIQSYQEVVLWVVIESIPILVMGSLWLSSGSILSSQKISYLVTYYILVFVINRLTSFYFEQNMQDEIRQGTFSRYLTKPISIQKYLISDNLGGKTFNTLFLLFPILAVFLMLFNSYLIFPKPLNLFLFLISLIFVYIIQFSVSLLVTSCSFFIEQAFAVNHLHWMLDAVTGGYMLPLVFYPVVLKNVFSTLPFAFVYSSPITIFTGQLSFSASLWQIFFSLIWAVVLYLASSVVRKIGIKKYSAVGG